MKRIILPQNADTPLPFYLAVEEWAARSLPEGEYFFAWQVKPTVICGRNQQINVEVNLAEATRRGINVCRRKSGGGAVYADLNNVMFSYITPSSHVQTTFGAYTAMVCQMLAGLGIPAQPTGRNDIAIDGSKVAGNAFYKLPGRSIVHGTMLYDADFETMAAVLTPSRAKQESKGVVSVPSRVTTLRGNGVEMPCKEFIEYACGELCKDGDIVLTEQQLAEVDEIMQTYLAPDFLKINPEDSSFHSTAKYIDGVGDISFRYSLDSNNRIAGASMSGDFFQLQPIEGTLLGRLNGAVCSPEGIRSALGDIKPEEYILGLTTDNLLHLIFSE